MTENFEDERQDTHSSLKNRLRRLFAPKAAPSGASAPMGATSSARHGTPEVRQKDPPEVSPSRRPLDDKWRRGGRPRISSAGYVDVSVRLPKEWEDHLPPPGQRADWLRQIIGAAIDNRPYPGADACMELRTLVAECISVGRNLNQMARAANAVGAMPKEFVFKEFVTEMSAFLQSARNLQARWSGRARG